MKKQKTKSKKKTTSSPKDPGHLSLMTSVLAHEINNPLTGLLSISQLLLREQGSKSKLVQEPLAQIEKTARALQKNIFDLQFFSNPATKASDGGSGPELSLERSLEIIQNLLRMQIPKKKLVICEQAPSKDRITPPTIKTIPKQTFEVLTFLLSAALEISSEKTLKINTASDKKNQSYLEFRILFPKEKNQDLDFSWRELQTWTHQLERLGFKTKVLDLATGKKIKLILP